MLPSVQPQDQAPRSFPLNAWYAAAEDVEVGRHLLPKTVGNRPIVFYRTEDGRPVALADACWHRLVPLSMGKLWGRVTVRSSWVTVNSDSLSQPGDHDAQPERPPPR